jgi:DNA-binding SARP family transcriptional activator/tetratricopeptide (TPR) repeat protein
VRYSVLGPVVVTCADGSPAQLSRPKERAVLAALLVDADRVVAVPTLIDRVWGDEASTATLSSLHASVSRLRKACGPDTILTEPPGYRLAADRREVDALVFVDLLTAARRSFAEGRVEDAGERVAAALALWRGEPYADVRTDFAEQEASRLWDLRLAALELQGESDLLLGRDHELVERLPPLVAEHPLREGMRATLMTALYRVGRQAEALELYERTRERFAEELGVDPSPALQRLHRMLLRHDPALSGPEPARPARPVAPRPASPAAEPAGLIGRDAELEVLRAAWGRTLAGSPTTVLVSGEAGIGKTRLVEEVAAAAAADGADVAWGRCADGGGTGAYWPWAEALSTLAGQRDREAVVAALAGRGAPAAALLLDRPADVAVQDDGPVGARQRLFDGVVAFLSALAADRPVLLALEDLHWADPETALLTEHVVLTIADARVLLVLTVRDPDELGSTTGRDLAATVGRALDAERLALTGLDVEDVRRFAGAQLAGEVGPTVAERLHRRTDGNPFFIAELVRLLAAERAAGERADVGVPRTVQAVLERRFSHLHDEVRRILAAAAVLGRDVDVRLLATMLERRPLDLADAIDAATAAGVLVATDAGRYRFSHALVQETLLAGLGPMRRAALHAQAAEAIEASNYDAPKRVAAEIARHLVAAGSVGDPGNLVRFSLVAADAALARAAYGEAEQHLRRALDTIATHPGSGHRELGARTRLAELLTVTLGYNAAPVVEERRKAFNLAVETGDTTQLLSALWGAWGIALISGDLAEAEVQAVRMGAAATARSEPLLRLAHDLALGQTRWHQGRFAEAEPLLANAVAGADAEAERIRLDVFAQHPGVCARAWLAMVRTTLGDPAAEPTARAARALSDRLGHAYTAAYLDVLESWRAMWRRLPDEARRIAAHGLEVARTHGFDQMAAFSLAIHGWSQALGGDTAAGIAEIRESIDAVEAASALSTSGHLLHGLLAEALLEVGDHEGALRETRVAVAESERTGETFMLPAVHLAAAIAQQRRGAPEAVVEEHLAIAEAQAALQGAAIFVARAAEVRGTLRHAAEAAPEAVTDR